MNIFRHFYNSYDDSYNNLGNDLTTLGFNFVDDTPITTPYFKDYISGCGIVFKWGADTKIANTHTINYNSMPSGHPVIRLGNSMTEANDIYTFFWMSSQGGSTYPSGAGDYNEHMNYFIQKNSSPQYSNAKRFAFIPLINKGFISIAYETASSAASPLYRYTSTLPILTSRNIMSSVSNDYAIDRTEYPLYSSTSLSTALCLQTGVNSVYPFSYFFSCQVNNDNWFNMVQDYGDRNIIPGTPTGFKGRSTQLIQNKNVCTLMKCPFGNKYVEGLYLCQTNPIGSMPEGKFFSFGGRNFFGWVGNLVVELPSD